VDRYRSGAEAVRLATQACELTEWKDHQKLATLAAAHADRGEFQEASKRQNEAMDLAPEKEKPLLEARLKLYDKGEPYREP